MRAILFLAFTAGASAKDTCDCLKPGQFPAWSVAVEESLIATNSGVSGSASACGLVAGSSVNVGRSLPGRFSDVVTLRAGGELNLDKSIIYTGSAVFGTQANEAGVRVHDGSAAASGEDSAACAADVTKIGETAGLLSEKSSAGPLVTKDAAGIVTFVAAAGDESSTKYFRVAASDLASATAVQFVVRGGDTAVVDVANDLDGGVVFTNVTHNIHYDAHAVYNFKGFSAVTFTGAADLRATIVAPSALVVLKNTVVTGAVFAKNLNAENSEVLRREVVPDCKCRGGVVTQAKLTGKANFAGLNAAAKKAAAKEVAPVARGMLHDFFLAQGFAFSYSYEDEHDEICGDFDAPTGSYFYGTFDVPAPATGTTCTEYTVMMSDTYGDGWNANVLHVNNQRVPFVFSFSYGEWAESPAVTGHYSEATICLPEGTFEPYACGGSWADEVTWSIGGVCGGATEECPEPEGPFDCYISECGCPGSFQETWCSSENAMITADWCLAEEGNCEGSCNGNVCFPDLTPTPAPVPMECYISQCGCPGEFAHTWCSADTAMITSPWCVDSEGNCEDHCSGSYCAAGEAPVYVEPLGDCFISQCGCPGDFAQTWCEESNALINSDWCTQDETNCAACSGTYCLHEGP